MVGILLPGALAQLRSFDLPVHYDHDSGFNPDGGPVIILDKVHADHADHGTNTNDVYALILSGREICNSASDCDSGETCNTSDLPTGVPGICTD